MGSRRRLGLDRERQQNEIIAIVRWRGVGTAVSNIPPKSMPHIIQRETK
jgi:hypothetical protein